MSAEAHSGLHPFSWIDRQRKEGMALGGSEREAKGEWRMAIAGATAGLGRWSLVACTIEQFILLSAIGVYHQPAVSATFFRHPPPPLIPLIPIDTVVLVPAVAA